MFINCGQGTIQMQDAKNRGNGMRHMGILYCFLSFSVILTIFKK